MSISIHLPDRRNIRTADSRVPGTPAGQSLDQSVRQLIPGVIWRIFKNYFRIIILYLSLYRYITLLVFRK